MFEHGQHLPHRRSLLQLHGALVHHIMPFALRMLKVLKLLRCAIPISSSCSMHQLWSVCISMLLLATLAQWYVLLSITFCCFIATMVQVLQLTHQRRQLCADH